MAEILITDAIESCRTHFIEVADLSESQKDTSDYQPDEQLKMLRAAGLCATLLDLAQKSGQGSDLKLQSDLEQDDLFVTLEEFSEGLQEREIDLLTAKRQQVLPLLQISAQTDAVVFAFLTLRGKTSEGNLRKRKVDKMNARFVFGNFLKTVLRN